MEEINNLIGRWQKITTSSFYVGDKSFINLNSTKIMDSIIEYEHQEINEKKSQQFKFTIITVFFIVFTIFLVMTGNSKIDTLNYVGFVLLIISMAGAIILNRTDDFPDSRLLSTIAYLKEVKNNITLRRRRHLRNTIICLLIFFPGLLLSFSNFFTGSFQNKTLYVLMPFVIIGTLLGGIKWFRNYDLKIEKLNNELTEMINEIKPIENEV